MRDLRELQVLDEYDTLLKAFWPLLKKSATWPPPPILDKILATHTAHSQDRLWRPVGLLHASEVGLTHPNARLRIQSNPGWGVASLSGEANLQSQWSALLSKATGHICNNFIV